MEKGDFKNWEEAVKFYQEEYKDFFLEDELDRILMKFNDEEYSDIQNFTKDVIKKLNKAVEKKKTKSKGSNPEIIKRNEKISKEYYKLRDVKGYNQKESYNILSAKYSLKPSTIRSITKKTTISPLKK